MTSAGRPARPLTAAIIGTGRIASSLERDPLRTKPHTHAGWYVSHPHILLMSGSDTNAGALTAFGEQWGIPSSRLYAAYSTMLGEVRPDLVSVCAYAPERVAMALAALDAGARGVWLEKAVATSIASARALRDAAAARGASIVVNHPRQQDPHYRAVSRLIADDTLGPLESIHAVFSGHLIHTGSHAWDVLETWCGPWTEVRAWPDAAAADGPSGDRPHVGRESARETRRETRRESLPTTLPTTAPETAEDIGGRVHVRFANGVDAFVSGGRKSYFVFQFDLIFAHGRVLLGNDVNQVFVTGPSPRYAGFIELTPSAPLDGPGGPPLVSVLADAVRTGAGDLSSLDAAIRALALGVAAVQAAGAPGVAVTPATLDASLVVTSV